jgi:hypothetical protein
MTTSTQIAHHKTKKRTPPLPLRSTLAKLKHRLIPCATALAPASPKPFPPTSDTPTACGRGPFIKNVKRGQHPPNLKGSCRGRLGETFEREREPNTSKVTSHQPDMMWPILGRVHDISNEASNQNKHERQLAKQTWYEETRGTGQSVNEGGCDDERRQNVWGGVRNKGRASWLRAQIKKIRGGIGGTESKGRGSGLLRRGPGGPTEGWGTYFSGPSASSS